MTDTVNVPREPTEAMVDAANHRAGYTEYGPIIPESLIPEIYRAMLASAPKVEKRSVGWDHKYRQLKRGEVILTSDEAQHDDGSWHPSTCAGQAAPDNSYTSHRVYRRLKHPAPASAELLEALETIQEVCEFVNDCGLPHDGWKSKRLEKSWYAVREFIAKHKGPQS